MVVDPQGKASKASNNPPKLEAPAITETETTVVTNQLAESPESGDLKKFLGENPPNFSLPRSSTITKTQASEILKLFAKNQELNPEQAKVAMTILFQSGGTAKSCDGNLNITIYEKTIKLSYLRKAASDSKCKGCERKLARYFADEIYMISEIYNIPGNLYKKIARDNPQRQFSTAESAWLSDFQVDNPNCPEALRNYIASTFRARVPISGTSQKKTPVKTKKTGK